MNLEFVVDWKNDYGIQRRDKEDIEPLSIKELIGNYIKEILF